jgi:hypothetical protein
MELSDCERPYRSPNVCAAGRRCSCRNGRDILTCTAYSICGNAKCAVTSSRRLSRSLTHRPVRSWAYGKQLKRPLLSAPLGRLTRADSTQLTYLPCRHHSKLYSSKNGDGSRCRRRGPCSRQWMTSMHSSVIPGADKSEYVRSTSRSLFWFSSPRATLP